MNLVKFELLFRSKQPKAADITEFLKATLVLSLHLFIGYRFHVSSYQYLCAGVVSVCRKTEAFNALKVIINMLFFQQNAPPNSSSIDSKPRPLLDQD